MANRVKRALFVALSVVAAVIAFAGEGENPRNFHEVDPVNGIYRSAQPDHEEFAALEKRGFRSVLNLRNFHSDRGRLNGLKIREFAVPCNAGSMTEEHVYEALRIIRDEPKSLLIHCWHGSDRTGTVVAAYRIVFNRRDVESAIAEMCEETFGHHATIYGNLPELLRSIDWEKMRTRLMNEDLFVEPFEPGEVLRVDYSPDPFRVTVNGESAQDAGAALTLIRDQWRKKPHRIVLLATHIVSDIEAIADSILLLRQGKLLRSGTSGELIASLPADWTPVLHAPSLEDVYLYYLGEDGHV